MIIRKKLTASLLAFLLAAASAQSQLSQETPAPSDLRSERIYSLITSRFNDGDPENNFYNRERIEKDDPHFRGDFKGLGQRLGYIRDLGFTAICITPPVENRGGLDFMGFNAYDWQTFEPRLSSEDFSYADLIKLAHFYGLKVIQTIVVNHSCNYGIRNVFFVPRLPLKYYRGSLQPQWPYVFNAGNYKDEFRMDNDNPLAPGWFRDRRYRDQWGGEPLFDPVTQVTFPAENQHPERFFATDEQHLDASLFHQSGWLQAHEKLQTSRVQNSHLDQNSLDLATDRWKVRNFFKDMGKRYINLGVDGFRIQFARNSAREDLIEICSMWRQLKPELIIFADVASELDGFGSVSNSEEPSELTPWYYTRRNPSPYSPPISGESGFSVMDYPLFKNFAASIAEGHFNGVGAIIGNDWLYADAKDLVTFFHNYDSGPESGNLTRFSGDSWKAACAYNLMWTLRGVPMLLMGEEIEFMKGFPQVTVLADDKLSSTGKAYFGDNLVEENLPVIAQHPMFRHIRRLNQIRAAVPALSLGTMENGNEFVSGISFVRNFNNGESYAVVGLSAYIDQDFTVSRVLPGDYIDVVTGDSQSVATDTRQLTFSVKGNSAGIWVLRGPGKIGEDGEFLR